MKIKTLLLAALVGTCDPSSAILHPVLLDPQITSCTSGPEGPCALEVYYAAVGVDLRDMTPRSTPNPWLSTKLMAIGIHCGKGSAENGIPFSDCTFEWDNLHTPTLNEECTLASTDSWAVPRSANCQLVSTRWGAHYGAAAGGECILFIQKGGESESSINTIFGQVTAEVAANSGNAFCQKPLPPAVSCDISIPPVLDHGVIGPDEHSVATVEGHIDCGTNPRVSVLGGEELQLAPGVTTRIKTELRSPDRLLVTSTLDTHKGEAGVHTGSVIIIASPY